MRIDAVVRDARRRLAAAGVETAGLDARVLASAAFGLDRARMIAAGNEAADPAALAVLGGWLERRVRGEPVGRILGRREFHGHMFRLGPDTLEPRPDTETLVDVALSLVRGGEIPGAAPDGTGLLFADLGTGTGAIAVSLLAALPGARGIASDIAPGALAVAAENAANAGVAGRLDLRHGSWFEPIPEVFGLVVSNPPYIDRAAIAGLSAEVREHDPVLALDGGADGLDAYRAILGGAADHLSTGGTLAVEIGCEQGDAVADLFAGAGLVEVRRIADLAGLERVVAGRRR